MKSLTLTLVFCILLGGCRNDAGGEPPEYAAATEVTLAWNKFLLDLERETPGYRPPMSARMFAYAGVAAYESARPALPEAVSASQFCAGYESPAAPAALHLSASVNAAYAQVARHFFPTAPRALLTELDRLEAHFAGRFQQDIGQPASDVSRSVAYGKAVADAVWAWSKTDSLGHDGFLYNFDRTYVPPACAGCWQPGGAHPMPPLAPHWGEVRSFVATPQDFTPRPPAAFDEAPGSDFYTEAMEVFSVSRPLSKENRWIAEFWSDDLPGLTMTPAGRWISITNQAVEKKRLPFPQTIELYLRLGLGLHDVAVICWHIKYQYNVERPSMYIGRNIEAGWQPLHDDPSFPSYPSGHSVFGGVASEILGATLGYEFAMTDRTHDNRREFEGNARHFNSFAEMARENALSRVAMGVHYRMDCEEGLRLGRLVGQKISHLPLRRTTAQQ